MGKNCGGEIGEGIVSTGLGHSSKSATKDHSKNMSTKNMSVCQNVLFVYAFTQKLVKHLCIKMDCFRRRCDSIPHRPRVDPFE